MQSQRRWLRLYSHRRNAYSHRAGIDDSHHRNTHGLRYDEESRITLDSDEEVRGAVALVFRLFRETGTAFAVVQRFAERGLRFPKRAYGGAWDGKLIWGRLTHSRVLGILKNPSYAGMYVFGRYQYRVQISTQGDVRKQMQAVAMPDWRVRIPEHHEGYITEEEFFANLERLQKNCTHGEETVLSGPAREGLALLQGLLLCGRCGRALTVRYTGNGSDRYRRSVPGLATSRTGAGAERFTGT